MATFVIGVAIVQDVKESKLSFPFTKESFFLVRKFTMCMFKRSNLETNTGAGQSVPMSSS